MLTIVCIYVCCKSCHFELVIVQWIICCFVQVYMLLWCMKVSHTCAKARFPLPSSRPEFTGRVHGPWTRVHFLTPELTGVKKCTRVHGPSTWVHFWHPSWRVTRQLGPWTRVVETGLKSCSSSCTSLQQAASSDVTGCCVSFTLLAAFVLFCTLFI